ncbi:GEVED domain-containing protein [Winogradskyella luteola]|uniref:T9SS type A sorting domain-containing protein n=1 Tax=Winogradskyella luteola TaxID=2828330 RepID=A0A9X1JP07_9FLAO|nr:GEVED domain-containing protein [Winogradskyella luteola]MBV7270205.1 T9SS type A sorting domain-containing protein [Winogradskyella luteola]
MKKITFLCIAMLAFCWQSNAQLVPDDTCTTAFTDISATGTNLNLTDESEANITLSFAFELDGVSSSDLRVGNNGGVLFNTTTGDITTTPTPTAQGFYPLATDIGDDAGDVFWEEIGTAPNRILVVQWNDRPHYDSATFGETPGGGTFQLLLYETTNEIRFIYEDLDFGDPTFDDGVTAGVHVIGANGTYTYSLESSLAGISCVEWNAPSCPFPSSLTATSIDTDSAVLGWTETGSATSWNIEVVDVDANPPGTSTGVPTQSGVTNPYMQMSLTPNTAYEFYVQAICGAETSQWVGPFAFETECLPFTPDYSADMSVNVPDCWEEAGSGTPATGPSDLGTGLWFASNHNGTPSNVINLFTDNREDWIISPVFDLSAAAASELVVYVALTESTTSGADADLGSDDLVALLMTTDGGANWTTMQSWEQGDVPTDVGEQITYDLSAVTGDVQFAFYGSDGPVNDAEDIYFHVSQFTVRESPTTPPACPTATATPDPSCGNFANEISWMASAGADGYNITVGTTPGGNDIEDNIDLGDVTSYTFEGAVSTTYYYTVTAYNSFGSSAGCTEQDFTTAVDNCYCIPPSTSTDTTTLIDDVTTTNALSDLSNTGTGLSADRYGDFSATNSVTSFADGTFDFSVEIEGGTVGCAIWVDWNNDFAFDPTTEVVFNTTAYSNGPFTGTITVPGGAANGDYRMRIMIDFNDPNPDDDACAYGAQRGETEDYTLTVDDAPTDALDFYNIQFPGSATITTGNPQLVYAQAYEAGLTDQGSATASPGIEVWIGYSDMDTDPSGAGWTWVAAVPNPGYDFANNNNDEYQVDLGTEIGLPGTYYYASRFRLNNAAFTYGGFDTGGGDGAWDGTQDVNGVLTIDPIPNDDCANAIAVNCGDTLMNQTTVGATGGSSTSCQGSIGNPVWYSFTGDGSEVTVTANASVQEAQVDVYESTDGTCAGFTAGSCSPGLVQSGGGVNPYSATFQTTVGTEYFIAVGNWINGDPAIEFDLEITCINCTPSTVTYNAVDDCANSGGFNIEVDITDMGSATDITVSDDQGSPTQAATMATTLTFGPYTLGTDVVITVTDDNDANCTQSSSAITRTSCPPANDDCSDAIALTPGAVYGDNPVDGTVVGASGDAEDVDTCGEPGPGVWYSVVVPPSGDITIQTGDTSGGGVGFDSVIEAFSGTCGALTSIGCDDDGSPGFADGYSLLSLSGLTAGETIYVRVWEYDGDEEEPFSISAYSATLGIDDNDNNASFTFYPNPVKNILTLQAQNTIENVTMYNMLGQEVLRATPNNVDSELDMSSLEDGTYFVKVTIANTTKTVRVIKQ